MEVKKVSINIIWNHAIAYFMFIRCSGGLWVANTYYS